LTNGHPPWRVGLFCTEAALHRATHVSRTCIGLHRVNCGYGRSADGTAGLPPATEMPVSSGTYASCQQRKRGSADIASHSAPHGVHSTEARSQRSSAVGDGGSVPPRIQRTAATMITATVPKAPTAVRLLPRPWLGPSIASRKKILPVAVSTRLKQSQKRRYSATKPSVFSLFPPSCDLPR
jgi:hypothetical protein